MAAAGQSLGAERRSFNRTDEEADQEEQHEQSHTGGQVVADEADTSTSAASSARPARRRRLARRRQYQKPRHQQQQHSLEFRQEASGGGQRQSLGAALPQPDVSWCRASSFERHLLHQATASKGSAPHLVEARSLELYQSAAAAAAAPGLANYSSSSLESCPGDHRNQATRLAHHQPLADVQPAMGARSLSFLSSLAGSQLQEASLRRANLLAEAKQQSLSQLLLTERKQQLQLQQQQQQQQQPPRAPPSRSIQQQPLLLKESNHRLVANQLSIQQPPPQPPLDKCIDNVHFSLFFPGSLNESSPITMNHSVRTDPRLYKDDVDIKFSRALNSCKLPQIRYASKGRLFERLTDLRFLSIDFLNTFLLTYRVFTCAVDVLEALKSVHYNCDRYYSQPASGRQSTCATQPPAAPASATATADTGRRSPPIPHPARPDTTSAGQVSAGEQVVRRFPATRSPSDGHSSEAGLREEQPARSPTRKSSFGPTAGAEQPAVPTTRAPPVELGAHPRQPKPPAVPPRNQHPSDQRPQHYLLAPIQTGSLVHKRRSTISALSPITSSEASSMNNLSTSQQQARQQAVAAAAAATSRRPATTTNTTTTTMQTPVPADQRQDSSERSVSLHSSLSTSKLSSVVLENLEEPLIGAAIGPERLRSSSVSIRLDYAASYEEPFEAPGAFLTVPMGRQVRSNSCSLTRPSQVTATAVGGQQSPSSPSSYGAPTNQPAPLNTEHWRLCYKKAIAQDQHKLSPPQATAAAGGSAPRRASSSDLEPSRHSFRMTLNLTPVTAASEQAPSPNSNELPTDDSARQPSEYSLGHPKPPQVPPCTPIEPPPNQTSTDHQPGGGHHHLFVQPAGRTRTCDKRGHAKRRKGRRMPLASTSGSSLIASDSSSSNSNSSSPTSSLSPHSDNSSLVPSQRMGGTRRRPSSQERDLIGRSSSSDNSSRTGGRHKGAHMGRCKQIRASQPAHFTFHPHLKEIELNDAKLLDYDTSADEDKIFTSSSDEHLDVKHASPEVGRRRAKPGVTCEPPPRAQPNRVEKRPTVSQTSSNLANEINDDDTLCTPARAPGSGAQQAAARPQAAATAAGTVADRSASQFTTPRSSFQYQQANNEAVRCLKAGVIVTASRPKVASRRSSTASAASAFAAATAASSNPLLTQPPVHGPGGGVQPGFAHYGHLSSSDQLNQRSGSINCLQQQSANFRPVPPGRRFQADLAGGRQASATPVVDPSASLCNSRASSRLSSCAGLENTSCSSNFPSNFMAGSPACFQGSASKHSANPQSPPHSIQSSEIHHHNQQSSAATTTTRTTSKTQINVRSVATIRVLSVLRHWLSKQAQDFVNDSELAMMTEEFLQELINDGSLLPAEHRAAQQLHQMIQKAVMSRQDQVDLDILLAEPHRPSNDSIDTLSALDIAECMTYLDHKIFLAIRSEEFLGQAWMKADKTIKAPHILLITKRFNDVSRLVSSEIIRVADISKRVSIIEKWANVAHICRVVHNFNGVLQICAAFTNSAIYRLKKTWDKVSKTTKATIDQLQTLVSTDSRFRNMRDAINRCDPPSIPYVGMYLADLSFIEEGTPNYSPDGLLNFSKMRMIAHVIREIQHLQNGSYKITPTKQVLNYLLDTSRHLQDEEMYKCSLRLEPKSTGKSSAQLAASAASGNQAKPLTGNSAANNQQANAGVPQKQSQSSTTKQSTLSSSSGAAGSSGRVQPVSARKG